MLRVVLPLLVLLSCSRVVISSKQNARIKFTKNDRHSRKVELEVEKDFYLWGMFPGKHELNIDDEFLNAGYGIVSSVSIEEYTTNLDSFFQLLSLGIYIPKRYRLTGYVRK